MEKEKKMQNAEDVLLGLQSRLRGLLGEVATALRVIRLSGPGPLLLEHVVDIEMGLRGAALPIDQLAGEIIAEGEMPKTPVPPEKDFLEGVAMSLYGLGKSGSEGCLGLRDEILSRVREL